MDLSKQNISRRSVLKALATVPFIGAVGWGANEKVKQVADKKTQYKAIYEKLGFNHQAPLFGGPVASNNKVIRVGLCGYGIRGKQLLEALGFAHPSALSRWKARGEKDSKYTHYNDFKSQPDLNIEIVAVCDLYDDYAQMAMETASNRKRLTTEEFKGTKLNAKRYKTYQEMFADPNVDAVIIATSDNWHAPMAVDAAKAGKHIYLEKPLSLELPTIYELEKALQQSDVVFQLGHQGRQTESYVKAKELIASGHLGKVNLIETTTNRNSPNGAWVYDIPKNAGSNNIDWNQWQSNTNKHDFSLERFFRWRCWWDYGTGLSGDLFTHEYDCINQIMGVGIPERCASSGGIYHFKDGRTVPDVLTISCEYPNKDLTFMYSATLANERSRGKVFMGTEGSMELSSDLKIYADRNSKLYREELQQGKFNTTDPMYVYTPGGSDSNSIDALTSATAKYFASRGLLYTYRNGQRVDTTHLHLKEWLDCIRSNKEVETSCSLNNAFEEGITALMANMAYREGRTMHWDADKRLIVKA